MAGKSGATPTTYSPSPTTQNKKRPPIFNDVDWVRSDARGFQQCRPAFLRTGAVNAASGSAYAEFGNTKVIVSVFGPRESKKAMMYSDVGRLNCNVSYTTFATPVRGQGSDNKEFSSILHKALEGAIILDSFPKTTVDVFALVLESGGSKSKVLHASIQNVFSWLMNFDVPKLGFDERGTWEKGYFALVEEALAHPYLARLHDAADEPVCLEPFSFDFEQALGEEQIKDMIYQEALALNPEYA